MTAEMTSFSHFQELRILYALYTTCCFWVYMLYMLGQSTFPVHQRGEKG